MAKKAKPVSKPVKTQKPKLPKNGKVKKADEPGGGGNHPPPPPH